MCDCTYDLRMSFSLEATVGGDEPNGLSQSVCQWYIGHEELQPGLSSGGATKTNQRYIIDLLFTPPSLTIFYLFFGPFFRDNCQIFRFGLFALSNGIAIG
jgi:hypothetical protein